MNEISNDKRSRRRDLLMALTGAFAARFLFLVASRRVIDMADAIHYINMARQFAAGDFLSFDDNLPILYSALGAVAHTALPDWEWAFWSVSLVASSATVAPVYLLARELFGRDTARLSALMICLWPWLIDYGSRIAPESLAVFLWFSAIWLLYKGIENGGKALYAAPLVFFLLHLTRPEGTFLFLAAPFGALLLCYNRDRTHYRRLFAFSLAAAGLLAVFALSMRFAVGTLTVSYRAPMAGDLVDYFRHGGIEFFRTFMTLYSNVLPIMLNVPLLLFLGPGLFQRNEIPRRFRLEFLIFFFCAVQFILTLANLSPAPRYVMTAVVAVSMWSARGMVLIGAQALQLPSGYAWLKCAPAVFVLGNFLLAIAMDLGGDWVRSFPSYPREYKIAGLWMKENLEPGLVLCRKPQVGFYADMPTTGPAAEDGPEELVARAIAIGARYVVLDERYTVPMIPRLKPLLDPAHAPPELHLRRADLSPWTGAKIVIYEVIAPGMLYRREDALEPPTSHMGPYGRRRRTPQTQ